MPSLSYITIENFRCFKNAQRFDLADLTLLVGPNSSGKSSLIRILDMLASSVNQEEKKARLFSLPIGKETLAEDLFSDGETSQPIRITLPSNIWRHSVDVELLYGPDRNSSNALEATGYSIIKQGEVVYSLHLRKDHYLLKIKWSFFLWLMDDICSAITIRLKAIKSIEEALYKTQSNTVQINAELMAAIQLINPKLILSIDSKQNKQYLEDELLPYLIDDREFSYDYYNYWRHFKDEDAEYYFKTLEQAGLSGVMIDDPNIQRIVETSLNEKIVSKDCLNFTIPFNSDENSISHLNAISADRNCFFHLIPFFKDNKNADNGWMDSLLKFTTFSASGCLTSLQYKLKDFHAFRGGQITPRRVYDELDRHFGERLVEFNNLVNEIKEYKIFISRSLDIFGLGDGLNIEKTAAGISINIVRNEKNIPIHSLGYGITQLVSLIIHIILFASKASNKAQCIPITWDSHSSDEDHYLENETVTYIESSNDLTLLIEEPEANLHPAFQSKLADFFILALQLLHSKEIIRGGNNFSNVYLIVETHSEYLIRNLQIQISRKRLRSEKVIIQYFRGQDDWDGIGYRAFQITIDQKGTLSEKFGSGFFDEATNLKFELLDITN